MLLLSAAPAGGQASPDAPDPKPPKDPYKDLYRGYRPAFLPLMQRRQGHAGDFRGWFPPKKVMRLSSETSFFTLNLVQEDSRANALVRAAVDAEQGGQHRRALKMYQQVIDKFAGKLYRVSRFGVFVPVTQYCQRRILNFPRGSLGHYRTLHDPRAREAFESARRKNSLIGLSEIVDRMLATSYGSRAIVELGDASLDSGHYLAALEYYTTIKDFFPAGELRTPELDLKVRYCHKMLGGTPTAAGATGGESELDAAQLARFRRVVDRAEPERPPFHSQRNSPPCTAADDYTLHPPTDDPLSVEPPVWKRRLPGSRGDFFVYTQPVVTDNSVIFRHKNIVYSHSILNGELRWKNDLGGRATWQNWVGRRFPLERIVVQDGLVFTNMYKGGPSLVALDQITGQLKWAYGPMVASTVEEARMRFEAVPAGGPRTIYAGYILDNIEGDAHIDTEYGVIAFESATGRVRWRKELCRLTPGKFAAGFARRVRNRIRSYASPPLYHQGTVYWCTNAGTVAALDARSGRIKWLTRYPYYRSIHDATRAFGGFRRYTPRNMNDIILWYPQRPLIVGDSLYVLPVDTKMMFRMDRRSGKVIWTRVKGAYRNERGSTIGSSAAYFLGPIATGELVVAYSSRRTPVHLVDPKTGKTVWRSGDLVAPIGHPVMHHYFYFGSGRSIGAGADGWHYQLAARPFLCSDGSLTLTGFHYWGYSVYGWVTNLCRVSLTDREIVGRRRYLSGEIVARASHDIHYAATLLEELEELPHKSEKVKARMRAYKAMSSDTVPTNRHGPFLPHCRLTFKRYGELFELRFGARDVAMVYDRAAVNRVLAGRTGPTADFAKAELAIDNARYRDAAGLLKKCLATISSEDLDFRAIINQQLYRVHRQIARSAIRARDPDRELRHCLGLSRTAGELADEIETLFALSEAYHRKGRDARAARCLQSIINTYGHREYPLPRAAVMGEERLLDAARRVMDEAAAYVNKDYYGREMLRSLKLMTQGLPVYASALSPLPKDFSMRAEDLAAIKLRGLLAESPELTSQLESQARRELLGRDREEQFYRLAEFAGTETAQTVLEALFKGAGELDGIASLRRMWRLADAARVCGLTVPKPYLEAVAAPDERPAPVPLKTPFEERTHRFHDEEGQARLMLDRRGQRSRHRNLAFFGERVRKRLDNKFVLGCMDLETGAIRWTVSRIRLKGRGQEPGFFEAFVYQDLVVVHGLYNVLAYGIEDHQLKWRYRVPFDFEIRSAVMSGDLLVLSGSTETIALYLPTPNPAGEVVWQEGEQGDAYIPPYFTGDRLVLVRKMPFNVTVRYRSTGKLIGRLDLPDLSLHRDHPLLENGREELSVAHEAGLLVVTDGWYYVAVDTDAMRTLWKRLIDANDRTREPPIRFYLGGDYLAVVKEDYDVKAIYMLASKTGELLWHTNPKERDSPLPMYDIVIEGDKAFGIGLHPGRGFYFVGRDCASGKRLFRTEQAGYDSQPKVRLLPRLYGRYAVVLVQDRQTFQVKAFDTATGELAQGLEKKGTGSFGVHGQVSAVVQDGRLVFLTKDKLSY